MASRFLTEQDKNELVNRIPTKTSHLTNDSGFLTQHQDLSGYALKENIPTKTSQLTNDSGFLTQHQDLSNYALKVAIPTKTSQLINDIGFLTQHQDLSDIKESINRKANSIVAAATGDVFVVTDSTNETLEGMKLYGKSAQFTTGGNQLLDTKVFTLLSGNGLSGVLNADGSITVSGTPQTEYASVVRTNLSLEKGTYFISGGENGGGKMFVQITITKSDNTMSYNQNTSFTLDGTEKSLLFTIQAKTTDLVNNYTVYPMLNKGATALPYEPYTGGIPSPNPQYPQEISSVGDDGNVAIGVYGSNLVESFTIKETAEVYRNTLFAKADLKPDTTYTFSFVGAKGNSFYINEGVFASYQKIDCTGNRQFVTAKTLANLSENNIAYAEDGWILFKNLATNTVVANFTDVQIELGSKMTDYKPYDKQPLTIQTPNSLPGIKVTNASIANYIDQYGQMYCCDEVDFRRGVYIQRIYKELLTVSSRSDTTSYAPRYQMLNTKYTFLPCEIMSTHFSYKVWGSGNGKIGADNTKASKTLWFGMPEDITTVEECRAFLDANPTYIYYVLETPIETPLSAEEIEAYKTLHTNYPTTTVMSDAFVKVDYVADTKNYIDNKFAELATALVAMGGI